MRKLLLFLIFTVFLSKSYSQTGSSCATPIVINSLPFHQADDTANYGNTILSTGNNCLENDSVNYVEGNDVFYSYTSTEYGPITITLNTLGTTLNSSLHVYKGCNDVGVNCHLVDVGNNRASRFINFTTSPGETYVILVSSSSPTPSFKYNLLIQRTRCSTYMPSGSASAVTATSATLSWSSNDTPNEWQIAIQPKGQLIPTTNIETVTSVPVIKNDLEPATEYQFWIRSKCIPENNGLYTAWSGPYFFSTQMCQPANTCNYTFRLTANSANGWSTNRMQVRQNGFVTATLGSQLSSGTGPIDVTVALCPDMPFDLMGLNNGITPNQGSIAVLNPFGQTIFSRTAESFSNRQILFTGTTNCTAPNCMIPPLNVGSTNINSTSASISWSAPTTSSWDIYTVISGSPAPTTETTPTANDISQNPYPLSNLIQQTKYDTYVRVNCGQEPSPWSAVHTFETLAICHKPVNPIVSNITATSAVFSWQKGHTSNNAWEVLLIPGEYPATPPENPVNGNGTLFFSVSGNPTYTTATDFLTPGTLYNMYLRTVCSGTSKSNWTVVKQFNTVICQNTEKCIYKFILTNEAGNSWNDATMQVKQNGITVATLGASNINNAFNYASLCNNVPFELFWNNAGTTPQQLGIKILNPFDDIIYTKLPNTGTPNTSLYTSVANCTQPACPKPTNLQVSNITPNSAQLEWASPSNSLYDIYVVREGEPAPENNPTTIPTFSGVSNSYNLTQLNGMPLTPATSYTFYVRKVCAVTKSTWTISTAKTFSTAYAPPVNDECTNAITITVNSGQSNVNVVSGSTLGATASIPSVNPPLTGIECGFTAKDIWYKFTALHTSHFVNIKTADNSYGASIFSVLSGDCNNLVNLGCNASGLMTNLTIGQTYYIRITNTVSGPFTIGITSPPLNDNCSDATNLVVNQTLAASQVYSGSTRGASASAVTVTGTVCAGMDDDIWYKFTATSSTHLINLKKTASNLPSVVLYHSLYSGNCTSLTTLYCSLQTQSIATGLTPGAEYAIRVYANGVNYSNWVSFEISVATPPLMTNDDCDGAMTITVNDDALCGDVSFGSLISATASPQGSTCLGTRDDDVWYKFVANSAIQVVSLLDITGTSPNLLYEIYSGNCENLVPMACSTENKYSIKYESFTAGQTYYVRVWSKSSTKQVNTFQICVRTVSTCIAAEEFCGSSPNDPYIFPNMTGVPNDTAVACLDKIPNPAFYSLRVATSGTLIYEISQNTAFNAYGQPQGSEIDVDFVAWGPFTSAESCNLISMTECPNCPNNNIDNPNFYPVGNIIDCSYSSQAIETLTIPNAVAGEIYIILVTNFRDFDGYVKMTQLNYGDPYAGTTSCADKFQLIAFVDQNNNGLKDASERTFTYGNFKFQKNNAGPLTNVTSETGKYNLYDSNTSNSYDFSYEIFPEYASYYNVTVTNFNDLNITLGSGTQTLYFPLQLTTPYSDVSVSIVPLQQARAGFNHTNRITYTNLGPSPVSGSINFSKDSSVTILSTSQTVVNNSNGFTFNFVNLLGYETKTLDILTQVPSIPEVNINDVLTSSITITSSSTDINPGNNSFTSSQTVVASYDPNDKMEAHGAKILLNEFPVNGYLNYTIRFQNTGTYYASTVRVEDLLDSQLDETSIRMESASHNYVMERIGNKVVWKFEDIELPSILQDEPLSHGYINFRIKPKPGFTDGDIIPNTASIFFDTNPPIITNTFNSEFEMLLGNPEFNSGNILIYPNPAKTQIEISTRNTNEVIQSISLYDVTGKIIKRSGKLASLTTTMNVSDLAKGIYLVEITTENNLKQVKKLVIN